MKRMRALFVLLLAGMPLYAAEADSAAMQRVMDEVAGIGRRCRSLNEFGRRTMKQSQAVLDCGIPAAETLSRALDSGDWKVRFWVVDMLGYLDCPESRRALLRVRDDPAEKKAVRERAARSLRMLRGSGRKKTGAITG